MNSKSLTAAVLLIGGSFGCIAVRAQHAAAIEQVMVSISMQTKRLDTALDNLGVIGKITSGFRDQ